MQYIFILSEAVVYLSFLILDIYYNAYEKAADIKFLGIALCGMYSLYQLINGAINIKNHKSSKYNKCKMYKKSSICSFKDRAVIMTALFFTLLADIQLLYDGNFFLGICFFIFVQFLYFYRISYKYTIMVKNEITIRIFTVGMLLLIVGRFVLYDKVIIAGSIYIVFFIGNICTIIKQMKKKSKRENHKVKTFETKGKYKQNDIQKTLFLIGMVLFLLCDINVGIYNLGSYINVSSSYITNIIEYSSVLMWFFYLPSQVLITLSADIQL